MVKPTGVTSTEGVTFFSEPAKFQARIVLDRTRRKLPTQQRHEQCGFTVKKSILDALGVLA